ncbi:MAG TPA: CpaF family protein [Bacillota bacterium]|nr:CpaF family protein [Bacillota bacterium]
MFNKEPYAWPEPAARPPSPNREKAVDRKKEMEEVTVETLRQVIDRMDNTRLPDRLDDYQKKKIQEQVADTLQRVLEQVGRHFSQADKLKITRQIMDEIFGYGPIEPLIQDPDVSEIMVNGYSQVYVEKKGRIEKTDVTFRNDAHVLHVIERIITPLGRRIDESSPMVDARLPDGSRVNAIIPPLAVKGPTLTIRKFSVDPLTLEDLISFGTLNREIARFLKSCVRGRLNIIVSGGTGSGKTTLLNVLSSFIPPGERIITIEDAAELQLRQEHVVTLESRPANIEGKGRVGIRELVINSLRMRPDRIVVGEVRGGEALDMLQAMNTGHDGSLTTLHANNPRDALARLETMVMMAGMELPHRAIREQISSAIDLIIQTVRFSDGSRKVTNVTQVMGMEGDTVTMQDIFVFKHTGFNEKGRVTGRHVATGIIPTFMEKLQAHGEIVPKEIFEVADFEPARRRI